MSNAAQRAVLNKSRSSDASESLQSGERAGSGGGGGESLTVINKAQRDKVTELLSEKLEIYNRWR